MLFISRHEFFVSFVVLGLHVVVCLMELCSWFAVELIYLCMPGNTGFDGNCLVEPPGFGDAP
jgi:hypothetical protein